MVRQLIYRQLAKYYDLIYHEKDYRAEARDLQQLARLYLGRVPRSLLDVGCGTGRHLAEFSRRLSVAGVELNPEMLRIARRRLGPGASLHRGDMRHFRLKARFDVVTCLFSAMGYMETRQDRDRALANFYRHLVPGGVALVEGWVLPSRWKGTAVGLDTYKDRDIAIARVSSSWREGDHSIVEFQYLVAERGMRFHHFAERERKPLVGAREMLGSFHRAGFRGRVLLRGPYRNRGLYVGIRPT